MKYLETFNGFHCYLKEHGIAYFQKELGAAHVAARFVGFCCTYEQLTNGDAEYMARHGYTLSPERERREMRNYKRRAARVGAA